MTFDHKAYQAMRAAAESRKTLAARLRAGPPTPELLEEAAAAVDHLHSEIYRLNRDAVNEQREFQREARDIAAQARADAQSEARDEPYGTY